MTRPLPLPGVLQFLSVFALLALAACAHQPPASDPQAVAEFKEDNDRLEPFNRAMFKVDQGLSKVVVHPIDQAYRAVVPAWGRERLLSFMNNVHSPVVFADDLLQAKVGDSGRTLGRIILNTTMGFFGFFDVASRMGIPYHSNDFGRTLASWSVGEISYLYVPLLGPDTIRDGLGQLTDNFIVDPVAWYSYGRHSEAWVQWTDFGLFFITQEDDNIDAIDELKKSSIDQYAALRSAYHQLRAKQIRGNKPVPIEDMEAPP